MLSDGRPTPQPPADGEVTELVEWLQSMRDLAGEHNPDEQRRYTRAADLLERPTPQPVAVAPYREVADLVVWLEDHSAECLELDQPEWSQSIAQAARFLHLYLKATPQPVAVSERLPEPDDCDEQGRCWAWLPFDLDEEEDGDTWRLTPSKWLPESWERWTHWLPANALPTPEATNV